MSATPPEPATGEAAHFRSLEALYRSAPINGQYQSELSIVGAGRSEITFQVDETSFHAAGAAHGTIYFKMLDDAAFYAANSLISDRFLLTTAFNLHFTKPMRGGEATAEGRWISGRRRVLIAANAFKCAAPASGGDNSRKTKSTGCRSSAL